MLFGSHASLHNRSDNWCYSDELSAVVRWYYWAQTIGIGLANLVSYFCDSDVVIGSTIIFAVPLVVIIISDCLCQQWLDRTHKVTTPHQSSS